MEEITLTVSVPFTVGNLIQKESAVTTHMEITGLKLMANTAAALILNPAIECCQSFSVDNTILRTNCYEINSPNTIKVDDNNHVKSSLTEPHADGSGSGGSDPKAFATLNEMPEKQACKASCQNALELSGTPLWGLSSVCGMRQEMEDVIAVKPQLFQVPSQMLMDDHVNENTNYSAAHFFGVYDGHGGSQVANYCREHLHSVLIEEIEALESSLAKKNGKDNWQNQWKKALSNYFHKVDAEVGGVSAGNDERNSDDVSESNMEEALAPETVGSTALVAILTQTHIIVANCGDSRAVLCPGVSIYF